MNTVFLEIVQNYPISEVMDIQEVHLGMSSAARRVVTSSGSYILRCIRNSKQALTEYMVARALSEHNMTANILLTKCQKPYVAFEQGLYNLQEALPHDESYCIKGYSVYYNLGTITARFHDLVKDLKDIYEQEDRFNLHKLWEKYKVSKALLSKQIKEELVMLVVECKQLKLDDIGYIHGDLGRWNLLFHEQDIYLIDFGEMRKGNNHFDIAALLTSSIDWNQNDEQIAKCIQEYQKGYTRFFHNFNWETLLACINLWNVRGLLAFITQYDRDMNDQEIQYIEQVLERGKRLAIIIQSLS